MNNIYFIAAFWFLAAVLSTVIANRLKISMALMEIIIGAAIGFIAFKMNLTANLALNDDWLKFCTGLGAIMLTFLSGAELNPDIMRKKIKKEAANNDYWIFNSFIFFKSRSIYVYPCTGSSSSYLFVTLRR